MISNKFFKTNYLNFLNFIFFSIPIGLALGPFIAEIFFNLFTILIISEIVNKKKFEIFKEKIFIFFYFFYIIIFLSAVLSQNTVIIVKTFFYLRLILFLISAKFFFDQKYFNKKFTLFFLIFLLIIFIDAQFQIITGTSLFGNSGQYSHAIGFNISGIFFKEEVLGSYLSRIIPIIFFFILIYFPKRVSIPLGLMLFLLGLWTTFFTGERVALFMLILNFIIFGFYTKNIKIFILMGLMSIILFLGSVKYNEKVYNRIIETTKSQFYSNNKFYWISETHTNHIISSYYIFLDNKILGSGPKSFRIECKKYLDIVKGCSTHPHNAFVQILTETGVIGFIFFVFGIGWLYKIFFIKFIKLFRKKDSFNSINILPLGSLIIQFLPFIPSGNFFNNWLSIIFFYTFSLIFLNLKKINHSL
jgi:O-antigen ligase